MKTLITTLNSKYIHKSLALRLLYVTTKDFHDVDFREYTIKDDLDNIVKDILKDNNDIVAFSVYIWNVDKIKIICEELKKYKKDLIIIFGGPEVSYEVDYFLDNYEVDYIVSGEGELAFKQLLDALTSNQEVDIQGVSSKIKKTLKQTKALDLSYLEAFDSPYTLPIDLVDMDKRILYFETSRGCPYKCQYCLSSLEQGLRFFNQEYLKKQMEDILLTNVKTVKLLDRSFNAKSEHALFILRYLFEHYRLGVQFQFEINGDVLDQKIIDFINQKAPDNFLRFEIGIQSTYNPTNKIIQRYQDFERLSSVIKQLQNSEKVDLHLDLIAGLPLESIERFSKSFDDVFRFYPKELQLGFLKLLRGTKLRKEYQKYGYHFDDNPPYEIIKSDYLSSEDIEKIHLVEEMLEKYWNSNKMPLTINKLIKQTTSPFNFFLGLGEYYLSNGFKMINYQNDELFNYLYQYLNNQKIDVLSLLIEDYLRLSKIKPKRFYQPTLSKDETKIVIHQLIEQYDLNQEEMFRYSLIEKIDNYYLVAIYKNYQVSINKYYF